MSTTLLRSTIKTPVGPLMALASQDALCALEFELPTRHVLLQTRLSHYYGSPRIEDGKSPLFSPLRAWLDAYFAGRFLPLPAPLHPRGSEFEKRVWNLLLTIPPGAPTTYGELAGRLGVPAGARAVGGASRRNPIAILVPCHRVIGKSGSLTGYGGGLDKKEWLLSHERTATGRTPRLGAQPGLFAAV